MQVQRKELKNQKQLKHINHLEELLFTDSELGFEVIKTVLKSFKNNSKKNIRVKMDGSPSIICGWKEDKFFVATKSFFNKTPKINYSSEDIIKNHENIDLQNKLFYCLKYLKDIIPNNGIYYQGDLLFIESDLKKLTGQVEFRQNILSYRISDMVVNNAKLGICFHTQYETDVANYNPDLTILKKTNDVFLFDNLMHDYDIKLNSSISTIIVDILSYNLNNDILKCIELHKEDFVKFFNNIVKDDVYTFPTTADKLYELYKKNSDSDGDPVIFKKIFKLHNLIIKVKTFIIEKLNDKQFGIECYYNDEKTNPEGYVLLTQFGIVKLVNRSEFSHRNFNDSSF